MSVVFAEVFLDVMRSEGKLLPTEGDKGKALEALPVKGVSRTIPQGDPFATCPSYQALSLKHKMFLLGYLKEFNATKAYKTIYRCSAKVANTNGPRLLVNAGIQKALCDVSVLLSQGQVATAKELRRYWTVVKRVKITDVLSWNAGSGLVFTKDSSDMDPEVVSAIKKIKVVERASAKGDWTETSVEVEMRDGLKASELLGNSHGMFK